MPTSNDAEFYQLVHFLLEARDRSGDDLRRTSTRRAFQCQQRMAMLRNEQEKVPPLESFQEVMCCDLAPGGLSFFMKLPPETPRLVFALGAQSDPLYISAEVVDSQSVVTEGKAGYRIGCRFTGRLSGR